jgi:hypothetical protein
MKPIAVFYHCRLSGGDPFIHVDHAAQIMNEQMTALEFSGLADAAQEIYIGVNGGHQDATLAKLLATPKATVIEHPGHYRGEHPTLNYLVNWLQNHRDWYVLYHHTKGAIHKGEIAYDVWRRRMQDVVVLNWRRSVQDLDNGMDSVGAHWLTPEQFGHLVKSPFWGGNFWWAKAEFLLTLPPMPVTANSRPEFYYAESWIGLGPRRPKVKDYIPGWP